MPTAKKSYYGPFFWLSLAAFIVPVFVAAKAFNAAPKPYSKPVPQPGVAGVDHKIWDYLLKTYVRDGLIDYDRMKRDHLFKTYLQELGAVNPAMLSSDSERLALLCNAYNAFVINGVIIHDIKDSVNSYRDLLTGFFDLKEHIFAGETISLNYIEHTLIRPVFNEPRIHMALVCAAISCPSIRPEAYEGELINKQLEDQAKLFANSIKHVEYKDDTMKVHLSTILKWYGDDFDVVGGYIPFLAERVEDPKLKGALNRAKTGDIKTTFNKYDWSLNTLGNSIKTQSGAGGVTEFGSGSIPTE